MSEDSEKPKPFDWKSRISESSEEDKTGNLGSVIKEDKAREICRDLQDHYIKILKKVIDLKKKEYE